MSEYWLSTTQGLFYIQDVSPVYSSSAERDNRVDNIKCKSREKLQGLTLDGSRKKLLEHMTFFHLKLCNHEFLESSPER